jgi:hypothetical protein
MLSNHDLHLIIENDPARRSLTNILGPSYMKNVNIKLFSKILLLL